ncbi:alcohol dehydrogenase catalytic domain-containing protein [Mesorhizobium sp. LjNodule214]|uniref:alcohol dehydrogenase catalytic domain-containing protein n=1 Tax=Mesorhizobium sp. LjNodule214 TaxID=3342252 RepID=UPI003ECC8327
MIEREKLKGIRQMASGMRAVLITDDHKVSVVERDVPAISADEILVKPTRCGICGTDLHILHHGFVGTHYPVTPGHEFAGHVTAVGRNVKGLKEGDFVAVDPNVVCGNCRWCKAGRPNLCIHLTPIGVGRPGAAAEFVAVPARNAMGVKENVGDGAAALIEPLACALHAVESSRRVRGRNILVIGGGTMGMLIALASKAQGAGSVAICDPAQAKLEIAKRIGITEARLPSGFRGDLFDIVFEAAGVQPALQQAMEHLEKTGTLVQVGVHDADKTAPFNPFLLYEREQTFVGSNSCAEQFAQAVDFIQDISGEAEVLVGQTFDVWDFEPAVKSMGEGTSVKTQLSFR